MAVSSVNNDLPNTQIYYICTKVKAAKDKQSDLEKKNESDSHLHPIVSMIFKNTQHKFFGMTPIWSFCSVFFFSSDLHTHASAFFLASPAFNYIHIQFAFYYWESCHNQDGP